MNSFNYKRNNSLVARIGSLSIGGDFPIALQSMTTTSTMDTNESVDQITRIASTGAHLVRLTTQGVKEATNLIEIKKELKKKGIFIPLSADIHFNSHVAFEAAQHVEKIRINPGNFMNLHKDKSLKEVLLPLLELCTKKNVAIRIGVNHGSLSNRILEEHGNTPIGMVTSCMEFLRVCVEAKFYNIVVSMKSSNAKVMVESVRLAAKTMKEEGFNFPLHLGVTEAGEGEDGRIKSAVGIGGLLSEGYGDTIRVSLTEEPEMEIPVAKHLVDHIQNYRKFQAPKVALNEKNNSASNSPMERHQVLNIGGGLSPIIITDTITTLDKQNIDTPPDYLFGADRSHSEDMSIPKILPYKIYQGHENTYPSYDASSIDIGNLNPSKEKFIQIHFHEINPSLCEKLKLGNWIVLLHSTSLYPLGEVKLALTSLNSTKCPIIVSRNYNDIELSAFQIKASADFGILMMDRWIDGIYLTNKELTVPQLVSTQFGMLQAARLRTTRTEYISCPGCGRTHFSLQKVITEVKAATSHLKKLKIGVMGCIVNGPGEMADADYGYVGAAPNKISIYKKQVCIEKNIAEAEAVSRLVELIKANGDWE